MKSSSMIRFALVLFVAGLAACSGSSGPGAVAKKFVTYVSQGNIPEATKLVSAPPGSEMKISLGLTMAAQQAKADGAVQSIEVLKEDIKGDTATVDILVHTAGDKPGVAKDPGHVKLIKTDGAWKISLVQ